MRTTNAIATAVAALVMTGLAAAARADQAEAVQTVCPVMEGNAIDPTIFTVHEGRRVYFCCPTCKAAFEAEPEKYLAKLPPFAGADQAAGGSVGFRRAQLIAPLGVAALSLITITVALALLRRRRPKVLWLHKRFGVLAFIVALAHGILVLSLD